MKFRNSGKCIIVSAPSGAGKTTLVHHLLRCFDTLSFSVSACSRDPRPTEINGKDYHFIGLEAFKEKIKAQDFVEWEEVYTNNFYGTLKEEIESIWAKEKVVVFDVDVIGGIRLKSIFKDAALSIFIRPPRVQDLESRLRQRQTESEEKITMRIAKAAQEMQKENAFDCVVVNDNLDLAKVEIVKRVQSFLQQ